MAYSAVVLVFVGLPLIICGFLWWQQRLALPHLGAAVTVLVAIVLLYAVPWDHQAAVWQMWTWRPSATLGWQLWSVPIEEYVFMVALTVLTIIAVALVRRQRYVMDYLTRYSSLLDGLLAVSIGIVVLLSLSTMIITDLTMRDHPPYLMFLLVWVGPVVILQWCIGGRACWRQRHLSLIIALTAMIWFGLADVVALHFDIWRFTPTDLAGWFIGPVPLEEELFYGLTALMLTQGYIIITAIWTASKVTRRDHLSVGGLTQQVLPQEGQL